jgi:TPR repeat protein
MKKLIGAILVCGSLLCAADLDSKGINTLIFDAKSGDISAQTIIGEMYLDGIGVKVDHQEAFYWLSKAARADDKDAQYLLGFMYENGLKVAQNYKRAVKWYTEAALKGDILSQYNLAMIYKNGQDGVDKDMKKAFKWLYMVEDSRKKLNYVATK